MAKKLMIVDEHAMSRHLVRQVVATPHDTVLECASSEEAVKAVGAFKPDCLVMGVALPTPKAFQAIKNIRQSHPQMRILAVSSFNETRLKELAVEAGASGYVTTENLSELFLLAAPERLTLKAEPRPKVRRQRKQSGN